MLDPSVLLLDEPSEGLAPLIVHKIVQLLRDVKGTGLPILLIEQNQDTALKLADRHYILSKGEICYQGFSTFFHSLAAILLRSPSRICAFIAAGIFCGGKLRAARDPCAFPRAVVHNHRRLLTRTLYFI